MCRRGEVHVPLDDLSRERRCEREVRYEHSLYGQDGAMCDVLHFLGLTDACAEQPILKATGDTI